MKNTESMTRDEILEAIKRESTVENPDPEYVLTRDEISDRMREAARLADAYMESERWDNQYIAEAVTNAMECFAGMLRSAW